MGILILSQQQAFIKTLIYFSHTQKSRSSIARTTFPSLFKAV
jgi:hypothetical protein